MIPRNIKIGGRAIGEGFPCYVIAEIGINHDGDAALAIEMLGAAVRCGADAAKLQIVDADAAYTPDTASYKEFKPRTLARRDLERLMDEAARIGLHLFATPGDLGSLELIVELGMPAVKISSGQVTNHGLVKAAAQSKLPLIVSTGAINLNEVGEAASIIEAAGGDFALLQCTSLYPAPPERANVRGMDELRQFNVPVGYSDHCMGLLACLGAVARGATIIEKHFTIDPSRQGADHKLSSDPVEFSQLVRDVRIVESMLGGGSKTPCDEEIVVRSARHRYLVASRDLLAGETLTQDMISAKRTIAGHAIIPANAIESVIGRRLKSGISANAAIRSDDLASD